MPDLITIVVPVYNVEGYLHKCLGSLTRQSYRNIQIILVDDGSRDGSGAICRQWSAKDPRIEVIHKKNGGVSDARNVGISLAMGKYLTFVDSDDWVHPLYVESLLDLITRTGAQISLCDYSRTTTEGSVMEPKWDDAPRDETLTGEMALGAYLDYRIPNTLWGKLYLRELFEGITFPVGRVHEDMYTTYRLLHKAPTVALTGQRLYYYRSRPESIMGVGFKPHYTRDYIAAREAEAAYYEMHGLLAYRDIVNERLYGKYERLIEALNGERPDDWANILEDFARLKKVLRRGKHTLRFRLRTEAYFASPRIFRLLRRAFTQSSQAALPRK